MRSRANRERAGAIRRESLQPCNVRREREFAIPERKRRPGIEPRHHRVVAPHQCSPVDSRAPLGGLGGNGAESTSGPASKRPAPPHTPRNCRRFMRDSVPLSSPTATGFLPAQRKSQSGSCSLPKRRDRVERVQKNRPGKFPGGGGKTMAVSLYLAGSAAFSGSAVLAGAGVSGARSTHSRIAFWEASPWRWFSFTMRV